MTEQPEDLAQGASVHSMETMQTPSLERPELPAFMTWAEVEELPEDIAQFLELDGGRPVWIADEVFARRGPSGHQRATRRTTTALERAWLDHRAELTSDADECWEVEYETNVFFTADKSTYLTPDVLSYRCLPDPFADIFGGDVALAVEVLSPSDKPKRIDGKKKRYAAGGIRWYWEVELNRTERAIEVIRAYVLQTDAHLPDGVTPLHPNNYIQVDEWTPGDPNGLETVFPFPIRIPWSELQL